MTERAPRSATDRLLESAEILISERGVDTVSSRDIAMHAGHKNVSAVQYHFGDKDGLLRSMIAPHLARANIRRLELLEEVDRAGDGPGRLQRVVEAAVVPLVEKLADPSGRRYLQLCQIMLEHPVHRVWAEDVVLQPGNERCRAAMREAMAHLPTRLQHARLAQVRTLIVGSLSAAARSISESDDDALLPVDELGADLIEVLVAVITAPDPLADRRG